MPDALNIGWFHPVGSVLEVGNETIVVARVGRRARGSSSCPGSMPSLSARPFEMSGTAAFALLQSGRTRRRGGTGTGPVDPTFQGELTRTEGAGVAHGGVLIDAVERKGCVRPGSRRIEQWRAGDPGRARHHGAKVRAGRVGRGSRTGPFIHRPATDAGQLAGTRVSEFMLDWICACDRATIPDPCLIQRTSEEAGCDPGVAWPVVVNAVPSPVTAVAVFAGTTPGSDSESSRLPLR